MESSIPRLVQLTGMSCKLLSVFPSQRQKTDVNGYGLKR